MKTYTYKGQTKGLFQWSKDKLCKCPFQTLVSRLKRVDKLGKGWGFVQSLTTPPDKGNRREDK